MHSPARVTSAPVSAWAHQSGIDSVLMNIRKPRRSASSKNAVIVTKSLVDGDFVGS
jgi:hypothetical protein